MQCFSFQSVTKTLAMEFQKREVLCVALHPGTVDTEMTKFFSKHVKPDELFSADRAARQLVELLDTMEMKNTGGFYNWDGKVIPY